MQNSSKSTIISVITFIITAIGCLLGLLAVALPLYDIKLLQHQGIATVTAVYTSVPLHVSTVPTELLPEFPWPPPKPSAIAFLTLGSLGNAAGTGVKYKDVDALISKAFESTGYYEKSYFSVPNGFAVATRLEQMDSEGHPASPNRWVSTLKPLSPANFSVGRYLQALFGAPEGHYRVFVFIVTADIVVQSGTPVTQGQAQAWAAAGANRLPSSMRNIEYSHDHTTTVYVYEFIQAGVGADANQNIPSELTGREHLERAGLWDILEQ